MAHSLRRSVRAAGRPLVLKVAGKPLGIWIFWLCLAYAIYSFSPKLWLMVQLKRLNMPILSEIVAVWVPFLATIISLAMRRLIAQVFGSISMAFLLYHATYHVDYLGIVLSLLGFACILANRRWFVDRPPNLTK